MSPILGIYASQISGHLFTLSGNYEALATVTVPSGGLSSITFDGIPQTGYSHLQIRYNARAGRASTEYGFLWLNINGGIAARTHAIYGNGTSASADAQAPVNNNYGYQLMAPGSSASSNIYGAGIVDILDYTNVNKTRTIRSLSGVDCNGAGIVQLGSMLFNSTTAVTSISIGSIDGATTPAGSTFSLYGVKA